MISAGGSEEVSHMDERGGRGECLVCKDSNN